jgi:hypothetical protein
MVNPAGAGPQQVVFQQTAPVAQQDVRTRNEQTQPRQAPSAGSQNTNSQRGLRSDDNNANDRQEKSNDTADNDQTLAPQATARRGSLLDLTA